MKKDDEKKGKYAIVGRMSVSGNAQMVLWADTMDEAEKRKKELEEKFNCWGVRIMDAYKYLEESANSSNS